MSKFFLVYFLSWELREKVLKNFLNNWWKFDLRDININYPFCQKSNTTLLLSYVSLHVFSFFMKIWDKRRFVKVLFQNCHQKKIYGTCLKCLIFFWIFFELRVKRKGPKKFLYFYLFCYILVLSLGVCKFY